MFNGVLHLMLAVLDLAVNSGSERVLLGITLHPEFPRNPGVYLYWTESTAQDAAGTEDRYGPFARCTPLLGNRVDRFVWNGSTLAFDSNSIRLRAFQADAGQPPRGNHNGGVIRFERPREDDGYYGDRDDDHDIGGDGNRDDKDRDDKDRDDGDHGGRDHER